MQASWILAFLLAAVALRSASSNTIQLDRTLLDAMREVESGGNECAIGDNGLSLGPYQIMVGYYTDASDPILGDPTLTDSGRSYTDVWGQGSSAYAEEVILAYMCRFATEARLGRPPTNEDIARIHNGGPNGFNNPNTVQYWNAVRAVIDRTNMGGTAASPVAGDPSQCVNPACGEGQCCQQDDRGRYRCFCVELVEGSSTTYRRVPCADCLIAGLDLVFVLDASGSITSPNFDLIRNFVETIVLSLDIGPDASQVGVIRFASSASVIFSLTTHSNQAALVTAVRSIFYTGGGTDTAEALTLLLSNGFTGSRPEAEGVPRVAIVVTDGRSNSQTATFAAADAIHAADPMITVFAAGIGNFDLVELERIASSPSDRFVTTITGFNNDELAMLTEELRLEACRAATMSEVGGSTIERTIGEDLKAFFEYTIPVGGFTIAVGVMDGQVSICGSTTIERPCCSLSTLYDWIRDVDDFDDVFLTMEGNDADNLPVSRQRRQVMIPNTNSTNLTMFVTIEGLGMSNTFALNTTLGDTRVSRDPCDPDPCDMNAICSGTGGIAVCRCTPPYVGSGTICRLPSISDGGGDDPHFSIALPSGKLLCYTVQGEHGFAFNLISNKLVFMNAMFVPDSRRDEVTWLGSMGIIVKGTGQKDNMTALRFEARENKIYVNDKIILEAKNIEMLTFRNGKLTISEAPPVEGFKQPRVHVDLLDVGLSFCVDFMSEHLDLLWHSTGQRLKESHGIIGQFFRKGIEIDEVRKLLILPGKEPVPVMRRPVWSYMERVTPDDQLCWTAMNPGYQGERLIDGTYFDYLVNDVLSTDFKFKKQN